MNKVEQKVSKKTLILELYRYKLNRPEMTMNDFLRLLYIEKGMTQRDIASYLHVGVGTISLWLSDCGIAAKKMKWQ